jgi:hypothetical protein
MDRRSSPLHRVGGLTAAIALLALGFAARASTQAEIIHAAVTEIDAH